MEIHRDEIELERYLGVWYQFASTPQSYEPRGSYNITATYARDGNGKVTILNELRYRGRTRAITGELIPTNTNGVFKVRLDRVFLWFSITAPYIVDWVIVDDKGDYVVAIVVNNDNNLYVLSRDKVLSCELQDMVRIRLGEKYWQKLDFTPQLCESN